ncbi:response regulator transcription factor [Domibacillus robiginosus]|uniref:response regulator transcription factor n=1 Tax=Domibacillus robiginosus TaxID=1071054 RepID=UPI00067DFC42|nr:response regulator [Domibacillus robiginosus]
MSDQPIRVIIVDDEPKLRRGIERLIRADGEEWEIIGSFGSGKQCIDIINSMKMSFDVVFTDVRMPIMDGLTMLKELNSKTSAEFFTVIISGYNDFSYVQTALREGAVDYLVKPVDRSELKKRLTQIKVDVQKKRAEKAHSEEDLLGPIQTARQWIDRHLSESITIEKIASLVYMNPTYFSEFFKQHTGETVLDYVTRRRMEKARTLLFASPMKIYEIAGAVGYADTKYFSKLFKKHYGELPSKYKQDHL